MIHNTKIIFFCLGLSLLFSGNIKASENEKNLFFTNLNIEDGLSSNMTNSIVQDEYGFIWIGTQEGLCRFDGYKMTYFQNENHPASLSSNNISSLLLDDDHIWIGTWDGLNIINIHTYKVQRINTGTIRVIRTLFRDNSGLIWIGTASGILIYNSQENKFIHYNSSNSNLSHNTIRSFYQSDKGDIWIGTYNGLNRYRDGTFKQFNLKGDYKPLLENNLICYIERFSEYNDSLLWIGTETGLALFNTINEDFELYNSENTKLSNEVIKCIYRQNDSTLWLGTDFGLNLFNTNTKEIETFYHDPLINHTVSSNVIWEIYNDMQNRLWLITSNGVSVTDVSQSYYTFYEEYFSTENPRIGNQVKDILVTRNNDIWLATIHGVIKRSGNIASPHKTFFSTTSADNKKILLDNVYALMEDNQNRIWIGTAGGINIWDPIEEKMYAITANQQNGLLSNYISGFAQFIDGTIWISAWEGGVFKMIQDNNNAENARFILIDPDGDGRLITTKNNIYYGTSNQLWIIDHKTFEKRPIIAVNNRIFNRQISALMAASDGSVWIGSDNSLFRYNPSNDSIRSIDIKAGRPQKIINIVEDSKGNIWATTINSIIRFNPNTSQILSIPIMEGSPLKGFYAYCADITHEGNILFGGDNGFIAIEPDRIKGAEKKPDIYISGLYINHQQVLPNDTVEILKKDISFNQNIYLKHNQNSITFDFTTLDYLFPTASSYSYRLLPIQNNHITTSGDKNFAVFSNLKPGRYTLELKGTNRFGTWSETKSLDFQITPSIWLSNSFLFLYVLIALSLTYVIFKVYHFRQRLKNELQIVKLEKEHSEKLAQTKIGFFTNISHEFRTPLSLIIPPIQELLKNGQINPAHEKMLKLANKNAIRLYKLVNQLLDFRKIESSKLQIQKSKVNIVSFSKGIFNSFDDMAARHEIDYTFHSDRDEIIADIDCEKIETILFNLISNAFKFTPYKGGIKATVKHRSINHLQYINISVKDTGPGIPEREQKQIFQHFYQTNHSIKKAGSGIGLTLAQEYAKLHNGTITLLSKPGNGSCFTLSIPHENSCEIDFSTEQSLFSFAKGNYNDNGIQDINSSIPQNAKRLLLVDDNPDILDFIEINLRNEYHLFNALNGQEALELIKTVKPHLIISDVMMPVMDGISLCENLRNNKVTAHIPIILLTARDLDVHKTEGMSKGADFYITKPFDIFYLKSCISSIFRREQQVAQHIETQLKLKPADTSEPKNNSEQVFLKKVMAIIQHNLANPSFSVEDISSQMNMSATHLYRKLKESTGCSTKEIIINYRLQKAAHMLENDEGNISEIMYSIGFTSLSSFSKSFKAKFGNSPKAYKNTIKNREN
ncbi:hybrid sensor histidine kinase/response regulator transcription factor [Natronoflexus pectinivorans]|uniref:histidine kinase n=1 Tax=Natronoflexus pectinivorans TaxID=682526 RepID=A0A4R2GG69_9BACT|nr:two-component regulator propeller domain-containing protein [Natronoflexus pectinivorans]TCO07204.1 two component regulator with propeller domain [Natronoflexus pectinivorans]